ncbi:TPA: hypothetical protein ACSP2A_001125 [Aeromonas hydrophila]
MAIKFSAENSNINVNTFVKAPESADIEVKISSGTVVSADIMFEISSVQSFYDKLGISESDLSQEQLVKLLERVIGQLENDETPDPRSLMDWASSASVFTSILSSEPLVIAISGILALAKSGPKYLQKIHDIFRK